MTIVYTLTSNVAFTDPNTVPVGCPVLVQHSADTQYLLTYSMTSPPNYAACVQLPAGVPIGELLSLYGDYANARSIVAYPASGETFQNVPIGPFCGNCSVGAAGTLVLRKVTATDWRSV